MKERPILFSGPMVRAILEGQKTQTRRVCNPQPFVYSEAHPVSQMELLKAYIKGRPCRYGQPGDRLWVRESHRLVDGCECKEACHVPGHVWYEADHSGYENASVNKLRPSIHMPRWASRINLEVVDVRIQRLHEISQQDSQAEGADMGYETVMGGIANPPVVQSYRLGFSMLWDSINAARGLGWDKNPWVWAVSFKRVE